MFFFLAVKMYILAGNALIAAHPDSAPRVTTQQPEGRRDTNQQVTYTTFFFFFVRFRPPHTSVLFILFGPDLLLVLPLADC